MSTARRLVAWVADAPSAEERRLRQAVHTILIAIGATPRLREAMIMKGAVLLAIRYDSTRYTRDVDFSTARSVREFDMNAFLADLERGLAAAVEQLDYGLDCRIQSHEMRPARPEASFPTLRLRVGYAPKADRGLHRRLLNGSSPAVVILDYSFNEPVTEAEVLEIAQGVAVRAYGFVDLIAEKLRAILQQELRNRVRRQDAYDLFRLLERRPNIDPATRRLVLDSLIEKCRARHMTIDRHSISSEGVIRRSRADYPQLAAEIDGELPPFQRVYAAVKEFYESLPWS